MSKLRTYVTLFTLLFFLGMFPYDVDAQENQGPSDQEPDGGLQERPEEKEPPPEGYPDDEQFLEAYGLGSQIFTIDAGLFLPLFFHFPAASENDDVNTFEPAIG